MTCLHVVDGGTVCYMECSCEYIEQAVAHRRQGVVLQLGGWARCYEFLIVKLALLRNGFFVSDLHWSFY